MELSYYSFYYFHVKMSSVKNGIFPHCPPVFLKLSSLPELCIHLHICSQSPHQSVYISDDPDPAFLPLSALLWPFACLLGLLPVAYCLFWLPASHQILFLSTNTVSFAFTLPVSLWVVLLSPLPFFSSGQTGSRQEKFTWRGVAKSRPNRK